MKGLELRVFFWDSSQLAHQPKFLVGVLILRESYYLGVSIGGRKPPKEFNKFPRSPGKAWVTTSRPARGRSQANLARWGWGFGLLGFRVQGLGFRV